MDVSDERSTVSTVTASFRSGNGSDFASVGVDVPVVGRRIDVAHLPEGRGMLVVRAVDSRGNESTWSQVILVDRTAPTLDRPAAFALGSNVVLHVKDALSGVRRSTLRAKASTLGPHRLALTLRDRAGNVRTVTVVVDRHLSLSQPWLNRDLRVRAGRHTTRATGAVIDDVFHFAFPLSPFYQRTELSAPFVREAQWRLQELGYLSKSMRDTGVIDAATIEASKRFQAAHGIPPIATIGPRTRAALDRELLALLAAA